MRLDAFGHFRKISKNFFPMLVRLLKSYAKVDVTGRFFAIYRSGYIYLELSTTLGIHLGKEESPGMASASAIGRLLPGAGASLEV